MNVFKTEEKLKRALMVLPEGCAPIYPLRTRYVLASQVLEAAGEEILEHIHERGDPEDADPALLDIVDGIIERAHAALVVLEGMTEELIERGNLFKWLD